MLVTLRIVEMVAWMTNVFLHKTAGGTRYDLCFPAARTNLLCSRNYEFQHSIRLENDRVVHSEKAAKALVPEW